MNLCICMTRHYLKASHHSVQFGSLGLCFVLLVSFMYMKLIRNSYLHVYFSILQNYVYLYSKLNKHFSNMTVMY